MRVLILGGHGMLGHRLWLNLQKEHDVWVTVRQSFNPFPDLPEFPAERIKTNVDAIVFNQVTDTLDLIKPDLVINCIGLIKQRKEVAQRPIQFISINALLPHQLSQACEEANIRMIQISTDCVFSGNKGSYTESDLSDADDLYGRTKYLGEVITQPHCVTLRTSIIGHELQTKLGLVEWFLSNQDGDKVKGYKNAIFSGFTTDELSKIIRDVVIPRRQLSGLYQVSSEPISKYALLNMIGSSYHRKIDIVSDEQYSVNRSLDSSLFRSETGYCPPPWSTMIQEMAKGSALYKRVCEIDRI